MAKKTTNSSARAGDKETENLSTVAQDAGNTASTPSGENGPDGTNTRSDSGDAAGEASADLVKPQVKATPTEAVRAEAETAQPTPEAEASASGVFTGEKFDLATVLDACGLREPADLSAEDRAHLVDLLFGEVGQLFGDGARLERREVHVIGGPVRHNNVKYKMGKPIVLTEAEHAPLRERRLVTSWETGKVVD